MAVAIAIGVLASALAAAPAQATTSTFTGSTLTCTPLTPHVVAKVSYVVPGDVLDCALNVHVGPSGAIGVTAVVNMPADTSWVSGGDSHDAGTITFGSTLGQFFGSDSRSVRFQLSVGSTGTPGDTVAATADLSGSGVTASTITQSPLLFVAPPDADLTPSALACQDDSPATPLFPGDVVDCRLTVVNGQVPGTATTQSAVGVAATVSLQPGVTSWLSGGTSNTSLSIFFGGDLLGEAALPGEVDSGQSGLPADFQLTVSPAAPGGTPIAPRATIGYVNQVHGTNGLVTVGLPLGSLPPTTAGPAILRGSNVRCADSNGGALRPGDDLTCTLTLVDQAGREDADALNATIGIPTAADWASGGSSHTASTVSYDPATLGTLLAGTSITQVYHLTVDSAALVGTQIGGGGLVTGTSEPLTKAQLTQPLPGNALTIGNNPASAATGPSADLSVAAVLDKPAQPVKLPSKGTSAAHVVVTLSNAGPSIAQQPSFSISLPAGAQFNSFDKSDSVSCARVTPTKALCSLAAGAIGAESTASIGVGLGLSAITNDPRVRVIALSAASATPDPTSNDAALAISVENGAPTLRAHSFTIRVGAGKSVRASVLAHVTGRPAKGKFRVTVPKPAKPAKKGKKRPKPVKGAPRKGNVAVKGTTISYRAGRTAKGSDSFRYTFSDGLGRRSSATVKVTFVKPKKKKH
jgi:hypothetical protein